MKNLKPKEPLIAIMLAVILTGLGQVYAGKIKRGISFFLIPNIIGTLGLLYIATPATKINSTVFISALILMATLIAFAIFVIIDAYRCTQKYNVANNLTRDLTTGKRVLIILGILFFLFVFNPSQLIVSYVQSNIIGAYRIPATSMMPTLAVGDRIFVDKRAYEHSAPERGDLAVFVYPEDESREFVKRIVGLPGETIEIKDGKVLINGAVLPESSAVRRNYYYNAGDYGKAGQLIKIPKDSYFVLGDNSKNSRDSRYWGFVHGKLLIGKATKIYYPLERTGPVD